MVQLVEVLAVMLDDLSSVPEAYREEEETDSTNCPPPSTLASVQVYPPTHSR